MLISLSLLDDKTAPNTKSSKKIIYLHKNHFRTKDCHLCMTHAANCCKHARIAT